MSDLCVDCKERSIVIKKWELCLLCYQSRYRAGKIPRISSRINYHNPSKIRKEPTSYHPVNKLEHQGEIEFIKNYFNHVNWISQPALFHIDGYKYSPDFYDGERNVFIEVSRTRQAYHANKEKYALFKKVYPKLNFEIRKPSGELLDESTRDKEWEQ